MPPSLMISKRQLRNATTLHEANFRKLSHVAPDLRELEDSVCLDAEGFVYLTAEDSDHLNAEGSTHLSAKSSIRAKTQGNPRLTLRILEVSKYTKTFSLHLQQTINQPWLPELHIKVRNYYDAGVTEVLAFQHHHRLDARYAYPNPRMHQRNEKWQSNHFLGEWLDHCIRTRCIFHKTSTPSKASANPGIS